MHQGLLSKHKTSVTRGVTVIEVAIGVAILAVAVVLSLHALSLYVQMRLETQERVRSVYLAEEGVEILRFIRDDSWAVFDTELTSDTRYFLAVSPSTVATTTVPEIVSGQYRRSFVMHDVYRDDTTKDIVASTSAGASPDGGSKEVVVQVSHRYGTTTLSAILTNIFDQ